MIERLIRKIVFKENINFVNINSIYTQHIYISEILISHIDFEVANFSQPLLLLLGVKNTCWFWCNLNKVCE